jgi:hypothetical protein
MCGDLARLFNIKSRTIFSTLVIFKDEADTSGNPPRIWSAVGFFVARIEAEAPVTGDNNEKRS